MTPSCRVAQSRVILFNSYIFQIDINFILIWHSHCFYRAQIENAKPTAKWGRKAAGLTEFR
jgi:hypothetical protein